MLKLQTQLLGRADRLICHGVIHSNRETRAVYDSSGYHKEANLVLSFLLLKSYKCCKSNMN